MARRWRPSLGFVLGGALAGTLLLSFAGLVALRYLGPAIGFRNAAMGLGLTTALATAFLGWLLVRLLLRPIHALQSYAMEQEQGQTPAVPRHFGTRELHETATRVIAMAEALRDREGTIRAFTDHVTHEIKTPVAAIRAAAELLEDSGSMAPEDAALVGQIDGARAQIETQLAALRAIARSREARHIGRCCLNDLMPRIRSDFPSLELTNQGDQVALPIAAPGMAIVLGHLLQNASESGAGRVTLSAESGSAGVILDVADDGTGILQGNAARIFEPFFTTRRDAGGTGMGLAVVRNLLQANGATIRLIPQSVGTRLRIIFATPAG